MSKQHTERVPCLKCGEVNEFAIWDNIDTKTNPEAKKLLLSGEIFLFKCPKCGAIMHANNDCFYHQVEGKIMIQLLHSEKDANDVNIALKAIDRFADKLTDADKISDLQIPLPGYTFRIVRDQNQLREKVYIFNQGLDDRVIEIMKCIFITKVLNEVDARIVPELILDINEGAPEYFIVILHMLKEGKWTPANTQKIPFVRELYDDIKADMIDPNDDGKRINFVNYEWALNYLKTHIPQ